MHRGKNNKQGKKKGQRNNQYLSRNIFCLFGTMLPDIHYATKNLWVVTQLIFAIGRVSCALT